MKEILKYYIHGWKWAFSNWKLLILLFVGNYLMTATVLKPLNHFFSSKLDGVLLPDNFPLEFNFTLFSDIFRTNPDLLSSISSLIILSLPLYLIWVIFSGAGIAHKTIQLDSNNNLASFWQGGSSFFFRFLRLSVYYSLGLSLIIALAALIFSFNELNIFSIEDEDNLISWFYILGICSIVAIFILKSALDLVKILIVKTNSKYIHFTIIQGLKLTFKSKALFLSGLNVMALIILLAAFYVIKVTDLQSITTVIATSMALVLRILFRMIRLASFEALAEDAK